MSASVYHPTNSATTRPPTAPEASELLSRWERVSFASGIAAGAIHIAFYVLFVALILPILPPIGAPAAQAAAFYAQQSHNPIYLLASFLIECQMPFLLLFFGGLYALLRRAEAGGALSGAIFAAGIAIAVLAPLVDLIEDQLLLGLAAAGADPIVAVAFDGMVPRAFALSGFAQTVVLAGAAALLAPLRLAPRWLIWLAWALAIACLMSTGTLLSASLFPLTSLATLLFNIWVLALSIVLLRRR